MEGRTAALCRAGTLTGSIVTIPGIPAQPERPPEVWPPPSSSSSQVIIMGVGTPLHSQMRVERGPAVMRRTQHPVPQVRPTKTNISVNPTDKTRGWGSVLTTGWGCSSSERKIVLKFTICILSYIYSFTFSSLDSCTLLIHLIEKRKGFLNKQESILCTKPGGLRLILITKGRTAAKVPREHGRSIVLLVVLHSHLESAPSPASTAN